MAFIGFILIGWLALLTFAADFSVLEAEFNSPASVSARARVKKPARCPDNCTTYESTQWFVYPSTSRVARCNQTMLLDFMINTPLNNSDARHRLYACTANSKSGLNDLSASTSCLDTSTQSQQTYEVGLWSAADTTTQASSLDLTPLNHVEEYMTGNCQKSSIFAFSESEKMAVGVYVGEGLQHASNIHSAVQKVTSILESTGIPHGMVLQYCGIGSNDTLGVAVDLNGDLAAVQEYVRAWSNGECVSGFATSQTVPTTLFSSKGLTAATSSSSSPKSNTTLSKTYSRHQSYGRELEHADSDSDSLDRRSTCKYVQVASGDTCTSLAKDCGITLAQIEKYNTACSKPLVPGSHLCCSTGSLPDFAPSAYKNGTCYTHNIAWGDGCAALAAKYSLTVKEIESFNEGTWGWYGCGNLQAGQAMCLSKGNAPRPVPIANAVCGPQVADTNFTGTKDATDWVALNPCPLNACCDIWGQCGATPDYCNDTLAASGAPGTAPTGSNGCIFNCGTTIVNSATPPDSYSAVGYFEAYNVQRSCLNMDAISIDTTKYTHIHFAFGNITSDFSISIAGQKEQFDQFKRLIGVKRIVSFGGWDFSTNINTYMIFREGVAAANRHTLISNIVDFVNSNSLDGVDFDWEYPGEPDIPGIPAGSEKDATNYLAFLKALRTALPDKSISIAAPASYWYLKAFPIAAIAEVVDYIVYMTYDLHGTWDLGDEWAQNGCAGGNCLFSHVNLTETMWALSMISKAPVATRYIMVGVTSYGRSFQMTSAGCHASHCTWKKAGAAGPCTDTEGYISNAEINQILDKNSNAQKLFSSTDDSDILVYNNTQWVAYMTDTTKSTRTAKYKTHNFAGTTEWAIDLEEYQPFFFSANESISAEILQSKSYASSLDLNITVDYNLPCITLIQGHKYTYEQLEKYVVLGALKIDEVLEANKGDPSGWYEEMTQHHITGSATCSAFPNVGSCVALDESHCTDGTISSELFWASVLAAKLYDNLAQWYTVFNEETFLASFDVSKIATDFTPQVQGASTLSLDSFLSAFSTGLGIAASVAPEESTAADAVGMFSTGVSDIQSIVSLLPSSDSFTLPDESALETALEKLLKQFVQATIDSTTSLLTAIFENPSKAENLSPDLIEGPFKHAVANYFYNAKDLFLLNATTSSDRFNALNVTMQKYMVGAALGDGDYYILRDIFSSEDDCSDTAKYYIDGSCYTLAYPGSATCTHGSSIQALATSDTIDNITSYGIKVEDMITNSYKCQNATGQYFGSMKVDFSDLSKTGTIPTCFYNLPVLDLVATDNGGVYAEPDDSQISPCWVQNSVNASVSDPILGVSYLPDNLAAAFTQNNCICGGGIYCRTIIC